MEIKKLVSLFLSAVLIVSMIPTHRFALGENDESIFPDTTIEDYVLEADEFDEIKDEIKDETKSDEEYDVTLNGVEDESDELLNEIYNSTPEKTENTDNEEDDLDEPSGASEGGVTSSVTIFTFTSRDPSDEDTIAFRRVSDIEEFKLEDDAYYLIVHPGDDIRYILSGYNPYYKDSLSHGTPGAKLTGFNSGEDVYYLSFNELKNAESALKLNTNSKFNKEDNGGLSGMQFQVNDVKNKRIQLENQTSVFVTADSGFSGIYIVPGSSDTTWKIYRNTSHALDFDKNLGYFQAVKTSATEFEIWKSFTPEVEEPEDSDDSVKVIESDSGAGVYFWKVKDLRDFLAFKDNNTLSVMISYYDEATDTGYFFNSKSFDDGTPAFVLKNYSNYSDSGVNIDYDHAIANGYIMNVNQGRSAFELNTEYTDMGEYLEPSCFELAGMYIQSGNLETNLVIEAGQPFFSGSRPSISFRGIDGDFEVFGPDYLGFKDGKFISEKSDSDNEKMNFQIWVNAANTRGETTNYYRISNIEELNETQKMIITFPDPETGKPDAYVLGIFDNNQWLNSFTDLTGYLTLNKDGSITVTEKENNVNSVEFSHTEIYQDEKTPTAYRLTHIYLTDTTTSPSVTGQRYFYPRGMNEDEEKGELDYTMGFPYRVKPNMEKAGEMRFDYGDKDEDGFLKIYVRGNSGHRYIGYKDGKYMCMTKDDETIEYLVPVRIYGMEDGVKVNTIKFHNTDGSVNEDMTVSSRYSIRIPVLKDIKDYTTAVINGEVTSLDYTFVGWSTDKTFSNNAFLSLDKSTGLYRYNKALERGTYDPDIKSEFSLIGWGNNKYGDVVDFTEENIASSEDGYIHLYPVYAVKGFNSVVSAAQINQNGRDIPIIGIADWKPMEPGDHKYDNDSAEKWLGTINIEVYKDGKPWVSSEPLYFRYENDNMADISIKFIWDTIVSQYEEREIPDWPQSIKPTAINKYMLDGDVFPEYDQLGCFVIDAVYAVQGSSESKLNYRLNWMTDHGGQLDNVNGGTTIKVYVTTKYNALYYLDDELITDDDWYKPSNFYTTTNTIEKFKQDTVGVDFEVSTTQNVELMDRNIVDGEFDFNGANLDRHEDREFSYFMHDYDHDMPIAKSPAELVEKGKELKNDKWILKDKGKNEVMTVAFGSTLRVADSNAVYSYIEENYTKSGESNIPSTYHFYAYTKSPDTAPNNWPDTGDHTQLAMWTMLMLASVIGLTSLIVVKKKELLKQDNSSEK